MTNRYLEKIASFRTPFNMGKRMGQLMDGAGSRAVNSGFMKTRAPGETVDRNPLFSSAMQRLKNLKKEVSSLPKDKSEEAKKGFESIAKGRNPMTLFR